MRSPLGEKARSFAAVEAILSTFREMLCQPFLLFFIHDADGN